MVEFTIKIPDAKFNDFKEGFLKTNPKPLGVTLSDNDYIEGWIYDMLMKHYQTGKINIARETTIPTIDVKLFEE